MSENGPERLPMPGIKCGGNRLPSKLRCPLGDEMTAFLDAAAWPCILLALAVLALFLLNCNFSSNPPLFLCGANGSNSGGSHAIASSIVTTSSPINFNNSMSSLMKNGESNSKKYWVLETRMNEQI